MIFDWNLRSRKHRTNADLIGAISPKKPFSSIMRYMVLWRHLWRYRINANIETWYPQKPHILTFTLIPSSFFSDHCVKLYGWMCITFQMPLVCLESKRKRFHFVYVHSDTLKCLPRWISGIFKSNNSLLHTYVSVLCIPSLEITWLIVVIIL